MTTSTNLPAASFDIQKVKRFLLHISARPYGSKFAVKSDFYDDAMSIVDSVRRAGFGFPSEIAETVFSSDRISEKQAYWIAKAAVENNVVALYDQSIVTKEYTPKENLLAD